MDHMRLPISIIARNALRNSYNINPLHKYETSIGFQNGGGGVLLVFVTNQPTWNLYAHKWQRFMCYIEYKQESMLIA